MTDWQTRNTLDLLLAKDRESGEKEVNQSATDVTQRRQQNPESPAVTLIRHATRHKVNAAHLRYVHDLKKELVDTDREVRY